MIIGAAGAGKTTIGSALAAELGWRFVDADDYHLPANIARMRRAEPLDDVDRAAWLQTLRGLIVTALERNEPIVLACSALKRSYRAILRVDPVAVRFVYLQAPAAVLNQRLASRTSHFAGPGLLPSQLQTLEEPSGAVVVDAALPVASIVEQIRREIGV